MTAVGYIRQSRRADLDVALSPDQQRRDIATLAEREGVTVAAIFEDLGRSGGQDKERQRAGYRDLLAAIEGGASVVYTKTITRLGRSVTELYRVLRLAEANGCRIVTMKEGVMDPRTPIGKAQFGMLAVFAEFERDLAVERAKDNVATRRSRGEAMGRRTYGTAPGEDPAAVIAAFRKAGSYNGAATMLNADGITSMLGRKWSPTAVRVLVQREAPDAAPRHPRRGARSAAGFALSGLLRCGATVTTTDGDERPCGGILTGTTSHAGKYVRYHCHRADANPSHSRPSSVSADVIMTWARDEVARLTIPSEEGEVPSDPAAQRAAILERFRRAALAFADGGLSEAEYAEAKRERDDALDRLTGGPEYAALPVIDWNWTPEQVNRYLRVLWNHVELGPDLRPVGADWRLPPEYVAGI